MTRLLLLVLLFGQAQARAITGRVRTADGLPAPGVRVMAIQADDAGNNGVDTAIMALAETDASGKYSLRGLVPGRYYLLAGSLSLPTYYPGVLDRKSATLVTVSRGNDLDAIDFREVSKELRIRALLNSDDLINQSWGGWLAGEQGATELKSLLEEKLAGALKQAPSGSGRGVDPLELALDTMSDALIRLKAKPSPALLEKLYGRRPVQALVLLSGLGPAANETLLYGLNFSLNSQWAGAANLLLANRAPGFVEALLRNLTFGAHLTVCDPMCLGRAPGFGTIPEWGDDVAPTPLQGAPPWPTYTLTGANGLARTPPTLLAKGPVDVLYTRLVSTQGTPLIAGNADPNSGPDATIKHKYIAAMVPGVDLGIAAFEERKVEWRDEPGVAADEEAFRKDLAGRYAALLVKLQAAGVLTADEAAKLTRLSLDLKVTNAHTAKR